MTSSCAMEHGFERVTVYKRVLVVHNILERLSNVSFSRILIPGMNILSSAFRPLLDLLDRVEMDADEPDGDGDEFCRCGTSPPHRSLSRKVVRFGLTEEKTSIRTSS